MSDGFQEAADAINEVLVDAETTLRAMRYNVGAYVYLVPRAVRLGFGKVDGEWSLYIQRLDDKPIDALRETLEARVQAVQALPRLVEELDRTRAVRIETLQAAAQEGRAFVQRLREKKLGKGWG